MKKMFRAISLMLLATLCWPAPAARFIKQQVVTSAAVEFVGTFSSRNPFRPIPSNSDDGPLGPMYTDRQRSDFIFTVSCIEKLKGLPRNAAH